MTRVVVLVLMPGPPVEGQQRVVLDYCHAHRYTVDSITCDAVTAVQAVTSGLADIVVCAYHRPKLDMLLRAAPVEYARTAITSANATARLVVDALHRGATPEEVALVLGVRRELVLALAEQRPVRLH